MILKRRAIPGADDGDDKTVAILNRLVTWVCLSGSRNPIEIEADLRHREILLAQTNLDGANAKSRTSTFRSATIRASNMSINRVDVQHAVKEVTRFMAEPIEGARIMLKSLVGHGRLVQVISEQRYVKGPRVDADSDNARCVLTWKSTTCAHLFHGVNLIKAGSWTQGTRSLRVAVSDFYAGVKGASIFLGSKSMIRTAVQ